MDEALNRTRSGVLARVLVLAAALNCLISGAQAETLADPTRPATTGTAAPVADGVTEPQVGVGMVVTAREGVMALMDGRVLHVGSRTEGGVVTRIAPDAIFVRAADGKVTRLPLYPAVSIQAVAQNTSTAKDVERRSGETRSKRQEKKLHEYKQKHQQGKTQERSTNK